MDRPANPLVRSAWPRQGGATLGRMESPANPRIRRCSAGRAELAHGFINRRAGHGASSPHPSSRSRGRPRYRASASDSRASNAPLLWPEPEHVVRPARANARRSQQAEHMFTECEPRPRPCPPYRYGDALVLAAAGAVLPEGATPTEARLKSPAGRRQPAAAPVSPIRGHSAGDPPRVFHAQAGSAAPRMPTSAASSLALTLRPQLGLTTQLPGDPKEPAVITDPVCFHAGGRRVR